MNSTSRQKLPSECEEETFLPKLEDLPLVAEDKWLCLGFCFTTSNYNNKRGKEITKCPECDFPKKWSDSILEKIKNGEQNTPFAGRDFFPTFGELPNVPDEKWICLGFCYKAVNHVNKRGKPIEQCPDCDQPKECSIRMLEKLKTNECFPSNPCLNDLSKAIGSSCEGNAMMLEEQIKMERNIDCHNSEKLCLDDNNHNAAIGTPTMEDTLEKHSATSPDKRGKSVPIAQIPPNQHGGARPKSSPISQPANTDCGSPKQLPKKRPLTPAQQSKKHLKKQSKIVDNGIPPVYKLQLKNNSSTYGGKIRKMSFGNEGKAIGKQEKIIMVVGATGAGKTTLINGMINYIFGVDWEDEFRFKLIHEQFATSQAYSQTETITSYTLYNRDSFCIPYNLTIIDTPGFGDTKGICQDKEITRMIKNFFLSGGKEGLDTIHAIGFVAQASLARLTPSQKYIFDAILSLFGKDIEENIFILATFADGHLPPLLEGIREANLPFKDYFKFNNSALYAKNTCNIELGFEDEKDVHDDSEFDKMFWDMGKKSFEKFLSILGKTEGRSLTLTKDVLTERENLEISVIGIQQGIQSGLHKLDQITEEKEVVQKYCAEIDANKNFTYTVEEEVAKMVVIPQNTYITNCLTCNSTCHYPCGLSDDDTKIRCYAMINGRCTVCPLKCTWKVHKNMTYKIERVRRNKTKTSLQLKKKYEDASGKKLSAEQIIDNMALEFEEIQFKVFELTNIVRVSLNRLQEIALKPNPFSQVEYIDVLMMCARDEHRPGWEQEVEQLRMLRKHAEALEKVQKGVDPFHKFKKVIKTLPKKKNESMLTKFKNYFNI